MDLTYIVYILSLTAGIFIMLRKRRLAPSFLWLGIYLLGVGFLQIAGRLFIMYYGSNTKLYLISIPITLGIIFMLYYKLISIPKIKKLLWVFFGVFLLVIIFQFLSFDLEKAPAIAEVLVTYNIAIVGFCLLYYYQMLHIPEESKPSRQGIFWIVTGFFFYFLLSFVYWMVISWFPRFIPGLRNFNVVLVIMFYLVLWVGILVHLNEKRVHGVR